MGRNTERPSAGRSGRSATGRFRLALSVAGKLIRELRRHPVLLTAPLAAIAVGVGFGAQALLRPETRDRALLEALIAKPHPSDHGAQRSAAAPQSADLPAQTSLARSWQAQRIGPPGVNAAGLAVPAPGPEMTMEIRVALLRLSGRPAIKATGPWRIHDRAGHTLASGGPGVVIAYEPLFEQSNELWLESTPEAHLLASGHSYEGRFRLLRGDGGVRIINHLPLENYVSSVVGGEMPSHWNSEALRAQAVAARSYALAHMVRPANAHWHLGDTTRWQNYEGVASITASTREATTSTLGLILSYQGAIVESLYAATQQIVDRAHRHLGASMSQTGAQELAAQGLQYNQILARYYPGASLARVQNGAR